MSSNFKFQHYRLHFNEVEAVRVIITQTKTRQELFQNNPQPTALCHPLIISSIKSLNQQQRSGLFWSGWTRVNMQVNMDHLRPLVPSLRAARTVMDTTGVKNLFHKLQIKIGQVISRLSQLEQLIPVHPQVCFCIKKSTIHPSMQTKVP